LNTPSSARRTFIWLLFLAIAVTAWLLMHQALQTLGGASRHDIIFNPGYQHAQRLEIATARAAIDAVGMNGGNETASYQADYRLQRRQIQADSIGLERWATRDARRQGLLLEIRASLAGLLAALDQTSGAAPPSAGTPSIPLLPALNRTESALSNYAASLTEPMRQTRTHYLIAGPVLLWWLLIFILLELVLLAWLIFLLTANTKTNSA
jgi:hypothetical protein